MKPHIFMDRGIWVLRIGRVDIPFLSIRTMQIYVSGEHFPSAAFIDYPHDWKRDAREMGK